MSNSQHVCLKVKLSRGALPQLVAGAEPRVLSQARPRARSERGLTVEAGPAPPPAVRGHCLQRPTSTRRVTWCPHPPASGKSLTGSSGGDSAPRRAALRNLRGVATALATSASKARAMSASPIYPPATLMAATRPPRSCSWTRPVAANLPGR